VGGDDGGGTVGGEGATMLPMGGRGKMISPPVGGDGDDIVGTGTEDGGGGGDGDIVGTGTEDDDNDGEEEEEEDDGGGGGRSITT